MARRIKKARIQFISLVPAGANKMPVIYKSSEQTAEFRPLVKATDTFDEKGELLAVVYAPEYVDADGDIASAEVIKEMAHSFMQEGSQIDLRHDGKALGKDKVFVAENFLIQKGDPRFVDWKDVDGNAVDVSGGWGLVIKVLDPALRTAYREKQWGGVSMAGPAELVAEKEEPVAGLLTRLLKALGLGRETPEQEIEMDEKTLEAALEKSNKSLLTGLAEILKPSPKFEGDPSKIEDVEKHLASLRKETPAPTKPEKPTITVEFEGDKTNPEDVEKHLEKVKLATLEASVDWNDPASVAKYHKEIAKSDSDEDDDDDEDEAEVRKARGASKNVSKDEDEDDLMGGTLVSFPKKLRKEAKFGADFMRQRNKAAGYAD